jgi:primosomal protein N' (replication factor Y)
MDVVSIERDSRAVYVTVALDQWGGRMLDYRVPHDWEVEVGMRVEVPLRSQIVKATIVALKTHSEIPNVKELIAILKDSAGMSKSLWDLAHWMAKYYCTPLAKVMKCFVPPNLKKGIAPKTETRVFLALSKEEATTHILSLRAKSPRPALLLEWLLEAPKGVLRSELLKREGASLSALQTALKKRWVREEKTLAKGLEEEEFFQSLPKVLTGEQKECLEKIFSSIKSGKFATHLIQGVTGSGKTEIYLQAIEAVLAQGKSAIMLVPEIALTSQTIERFRSRFQHKIAIWHHRRSLQERALAWNHLQSGEAKIVIGARSAIFSPIQKVGIVIVDEEHDTSYKQSEEMPCYQARDIAVMRAYLENSVVLLGSATPSIESRHNADRGKYLLSELSFRATAAPMPKVTIVDMKDEFDRAGGFTHFSEVLIEGLKTRLKAGEQSLLFLNKRGYHRLQVCAHCRNAVKCPRCDLGLTYHKTEQQLRCHLCDHSQAITLHCPQCGAAESLQFKGFGTEHVEKALYALLPGIRILRMDRDTTRKKEGHEELYRQFRSHKADVLIGTQMIAKGFHFPSATLVGVLNADASLSIPDFRSSEQAFQLITQVSGRAGRSELPGEVILQTFLPHHPVIRWAAAQDYNTFYAAELSERRLFSFPPFSHLVKISCAGKNSEETEQATQALHRQLAEQKIDGMELMPVLPAGHAKVKDLYRFQFVIKIASLQRLQSVLPSLISKTPFKIDVDPVSTFF